MIKQLNTLSREDNAHVMTDGYHIFEWLPGLKIDDEENMDNDMETEVIN